MRRLQNAKLLETKEILAAKTAVAWIGMASAAWQHEIINNAQIIKELVFVLNAILYNKPTYIERYEL